MNLYIVVREDETWYDECTEQTILAENENKALEMASKEYGKWRIHEVVDMTKPKVLTQHFIYG